MKNIAIVIAVSEYHTPNKSLPACKRDGAAIAAILETESRFDDVLIIDADTTSQSVKRKLVEFLTKFAGGNTVDKIGDLFFYYTGHGVFSDSEFYYMFSDYDAKRQKQTALENSELDNLIRNLEPETFIKVVDACYSGVSYIKDFNSIEFYLKKASAAFKKIYFMFSSQADQPSWADHTLSYFTRSFIQALDSHSSGAVRYKDIMDHISDHFASTGSQTPLFVVQAQLTEIFCTISDSIRSTLSQYIPASGSEDAGKSGQSLSPQQTLLQKIQEDATWFCTESEAIERLKEMSNRIRSTIVVPELSDFYEIETSERDGSHIPNASAIAQWLDRNPPEKGYFVEVSKATLPPDQEAERAVDSLAGPDLCKTLIVLLSQKNQPYWEPIGSNWNAINDIYLNDFSQIIPLRSRPLGGYWPWMKQILASSQKKQPLVTGFKSTVDLPYRCVQVYAKGKYPNIEDLACFIVPVLSRTKVLLFWTNCAYEEIGWNDQKIGNCAWSNSEFLLKDHDAASKVINGIADGFQNFLKSRLMEKWENKSESLPIVVHDNSVDGEILSKSEYSRSVPAVSDEST